MLEAFAQECQGHMSGDEINTDVMFLQSRIDSMSKSSGHNLASLAADSSSNILEVQLLKSPDVSSMHKRVRRLQALKGDVIVGTLNAPKAARRSLSPNDLCKDSIVFPALIEARFGSRDVTVRDKLKRRLHADSFCFDSNIRIVDKVELAVGKVARAGFLSLEFCHLRINYCKAHHTAHTKSYKKFLSSVEILYNRITRFWNSLKKHPAVSNKLKVLEVLCADPCTSFSQHDGLWPNFVDSINILKKQTEYLRSILEEIISTAKYIIRKRDNFAEALQQYLEMHVRFFEQTKTMYERSRILRNRQLAQLNAKAKEFSSLPHKDGLNKGLLEKMFVIMAHYQNACEKQLRVAANAATFVSYLPAHLQSFDIALKKYRHLEWDFLEKLKKNVRHCVTFGVLTFANILLNFARQHVLPGLVALPDLSKHHLLVGTPDEDQCGSAVQQLEKVFNSWLNGMRITKQTCRQAYSLTVFKEQAYQNFFGNKTSSFSFSSAFSAKRSGARTSTSSRMIGTPTKYAGEVHADKASGSHRTLPVDPSATSAATAKSSPKCELEADTSSDNVVPASLDVANEQTSAVISNSEDLDCSHSDADSDNGAAQDIGTAACTTNANPVTATETVETDSNGVVASASPAITSISNSNIAPPLPKRKLSKELAVPRLDWVLKNAGTYLVENTDVLFSDLMNSISTHQMQTVWNLYNKTKSERARLLEERETRRQVVLRCQQIFNAALEEAEAAPKVTDAIREKVRAQERKCNEGAPLLQCRITSQNAISLNSWRRWQRGVRVKVKDASAFLEGGDKVCPGHLLLKIGDTIMMGMKKQDIKACLASATFPTQITLGNQQHTTLWKLESDAQANRQREEQLMVKLGEAQETLLQQEQSYLQFKRETVALFERLERERVDQLLSSMSASARMDIDNLSRFKEYSSQYDNAVKSIDLKHEHKSWVEFNSELKTRQRTLLENAAPFSDRYARVYVGSNRSRRLEAAQLQSQSGASTENRVAGESNATGSGEIQRPEHGDYYSWEISSLWEPHFNSRMASTFPCSNIGSLVEGDYIDIHAIEPTAYDNFIALLEGAGEACRRTQHFLDTATKIEQSLLNNLRKLCSSWESGAASMLNSQHSNPATETDGPETLGSDTSGRRVKPTSISNADPSDTQSNPAAVLTPCVKGIREFVCVRMKTVRDWCAGLRHAADGLRIFKHAATKLQDAVKSHRDMISNVLATAQNQYDTCEKRQNKENIVCEQVLKFRTQAAKQFLTAAKQSYQTQMVQLISFGMQRLKRWLHGVHQRVLGPLHLAFENYSNSCKRNTDTVLQHVRDSILDPASLQRVKTTVETTINQTGEMASDYFSIAERRTNGFSAARSCAVGHQTRTKQMHESLQKFLQQLWDHAKKVINERKPKVDNGSISALSISKALEAVVTGVYSVAFTTLLRCCNSNDRAQFQLHCAGDIPKWDLLTTLATTRSLEWFTTKLTNPDQRADLDFLKHTKQYKELLQAWAATDDIQDRYSRNLITTESGSNMRPSQRFSLLNIQQHAAQMEDTFFSDHATASRPRLSTECANTLAANLKAIRAVDVSKLQKSGDEGVDACVRQIFRQAEEEVCTGLDSAFKEYKKSKRALKFRLDLQKLDSNVLPALSELPEVTKTCCRLAETLWTEWGRDVECLSRIMEVMAAELSTQDGKNTRMQRLHRKYKKKDVDVAKETEYKKAKAAAIESIKGICVRSLDGGASCLDQLTTTEYWFSGSLHTISQLVSSACKAIDVEADVRNVLKQYVPTVTTSTMKNQDTGSNKPSDNWDEDSDS